MTEPSPTTHRPVPAMPAFAAFYKAVNGGRDPFPWQAKLADRLAGDGEWLPVGVPTGMGKTACLDIAVWWLASQADRGPAERTAPTRIWWVVNRRLLVDSTTAHAEEIAGALRDPGKHGLAGQPADDVASVATRLRSLSADSQGEPLEVIRLRAGIPSRTPTDPSRPAVVLCTLPMYGSRLLFRGYGSTRKLRPIDAAMAGTDSLVLLDEAHLAPHLSRLLPALADCTPGARAVLPDRRSRPRLVTLTATGDVGAGPRVDLDDDDLANPVVRQRLDAVKPVALGDALRRAAAAGPRQRLDAVKPVALSLKAGDTASHLARGATAGRTAPRPRRLSLKAGDTASHLADAMLDLIRDAPSPAACIVFANTPETARATFKKMTRATGAGRADIMLLTGRARELEAERIRKRILDPVDGMAAGRDAAARRQRHLIVVATQTLEVGADVDAEYLVTEQCGVRALTQRLGRLNRLGRHPHARAVYVHCPPPERGKRNKRTDADSSEWPVYGKEPLAVRQKLENACRDSPTKIVNLSPRRIAAILGSPDDDPGRAPEVLPGLLWEWTKTTTPPPDEAPVEPYFCGIAGPEYAVSLIWRAHVPKPGELLWPRASDWEAVDIPIEEVRRAFGNDEDLRRLGPDGVTVEGVSPEELRPGDVVVVPSDRGLLDEFGWDPSADKPVVDVSLVRHGLPLDATAIHRLCGISVGHLLGTALGAADDDEDVDPTKQDEAVEEIRAAVVGAQPPPGWDEGEWQDFTNALGRQVVAPDNEVPRLRAPRAAPEPRNDELDETSMAETAVDLDLHCRAVAARARSIADRLGLADQLAEVVERAGLLHDVGKADSRFQRWLDPEGAREGRAAKSAMPRHMWNAARIAAGWPRGGRHEELSARLVLRWLELCPAWGDPTERPASDAPPFVRDLLVHLVISHHGKGRPLVPPVKDGTMAAVSAVVDGVSVTAPADLAIVDWKQPARFRRLNDRFGPWGLALLEAIVVRSDHSVSGGADVQLAEAP